MSHRPCIIEEALAQPGADKWRQALETKVLAIHSTKAYALAFKPEGKCRRVQNDVQQKTSRG